MDEFGQKVVIAQRTVRLANVRNGLRKITLRNERDNKTFPMAQVLVNIKVFTTAEIEQEDAKLNHAIEVRLLKKKTPNQFSRLQLTRKRLLAWITTLNKG